MGYTDEAIRKLYSEQVQDQLRYLYGNDSEILKKQTERYASLLRRHAELFGEKPDVQLVSAPGRTEIGGNHTDHNHGRVLAASVNLDALCAVSPRNDLNVCFHSEGYDPIKMDLTDLAGRPEEKGTTKGLIRGVAAGMQSYGTDPQRPKTISDRYRNGCRISGACAEDRSERPGEAGSDQAEQ